MSDERTPAFLISARREDRYQVLTAALVYLNAAGQVRNYVSSSGLHRDEDAFADLQIRAQQSAGENTSYGFSAEFMNVYSVNLTRAQAMVKTLKRIDRGLDKLENDFGYATDFGSYLARVGNVLKVKHYGWRLRERRGFGSYDENDYLWTDASSAVIYIQGLINSFADETQEVIA